jgi:hypothetical protein
MNTLMLDPETWDLMIDSSKNIAMASDPYSQAQDAASSIKVFLGECYYDTLLGIPYFESIFGKLPPLGLIKSEINQQALLVPGVATSACFITSFVNRKLSGQVQIVNAVGDKSAASF